jgi:hypothetical protein
MAQQMTQMSSKWLPAIGAEVLVVAAYAEIWSGIGGTKLLGNIPVVGGTVTCDRANAYRRVVANLTMLPDVAGQLMPLVNGSGLLYPRGNEIRLFKGIKYSNGSSEYASLGSFLLQEVDVNEDTSGVTFDGTLQDRGYTVSRARFTQSYQTSGTNTTDIEIYNIINAQVAGLSYAFTPAITAGGVSIIPTVQTYNAGDDAWAACLQLASDAGMELFFDYNGVCTLQFIQNPLNTASVASYLSGGFAAPVVIKRKLSNLNVPNVIIGQSSGSGVTTPLQTYWWDNNVGSATFYAAGTPGPTLPAKTGTYPTLVATLTTNAATTLAQLQNAVNNAGLSVIGTIEGGNISIRDNAAQDVNDVVTLFSVNAGITSATNYIFDQCVIDMSTQNPLTGIVRLVV